MHPEVRPATTEGGREDGPAQETGSPPMAATLKPAHTVDLEGGRDLSFLCEYLPLHTAAVLPGRQCPLSHSVPWAAAQTLWPSSPAKGLGEVGARLQERPGGGAVWVSGAGCLSRLHSLSPPTAAGDQVPEGSLEPETRAGTAPNHGLLHLLAVVGSELSPPPTPPRSLWHPHSHSRGRRGRGRCSRP